MALNFQQVVLKLHEFWAAHGCVIWNPYNVQVGAGTGNPATLLRVVGPEPWRVAYVEPSVRPDDGRYGENPNRMQYYFQYQVILKPDPGNPQELYLQSLEALGINPREHDIRFVEDNWESPALGAWGLGWEVWLDGQEITQFTYFQQAGGIELTPVSVEITYGLERIVLALQGKDAAWDIEWLGDLQYRDVLLQSEIEHCKYQFELADIESLMSVYDEYEAEYKRALAGGAIIPAYDYVLKCSHQFNVLDARGAIGVTERAGYFRRMREMTRSIAKAYAQQRESLGYPLLKMEKTWGAPPLQTAALQTAANGTAPTTEADFVLEIGVEELPPDDLASAHEQLEKIGETLFESLRLNVGTVQVFGTPRRLTLAAFAVAPRQSDEARIERGPTVDRAYDADGKPTKAAEGFAKGKGVAVSDLQIAEMDGGRYVTAHVNIIGRPAVDVLAEALPNVIAQLKFGKTMRWNATAVAFSRPIRWLVALLGEAVVPFTYSGLASGNTSRGLRPYGSPSISIKNAAGYVQTLKTHGIVLNQEERRERIRAQVDALAAQVGGRSLPNEDLLAEVTNLVEMPTALRGDFDPKYLELPRDVLVTVMRKKQRYFALETPQGDLLPHFITVRNGDHEHLDKVQHGNEHVLTARFADASFFFREDLKKPLRDYLPRLSTMTFQEKLGSMLDKNERIGKLVDPLGALLHTPTLNQAIAADAAVILKADLATQMVVEMTSLQGTMGREYALRSGATPVVANAIYEHWLPRGAGDHLPHSPAAILLSVADKLDSLVGLFAAGLAPRSTTDPYGLRRAALGVVQIVRAHSIDVDLRTAIAAVAAVQPIAADATVQAQVLEFISGRLEALLREENKFAPDIISAVLAEQAHNPHRVNAALSELTAWVQRDDWAATLDGFARCVRITRPEATQYTLTPTAFKEPQEQALYAAYQTAAAALKPTDNVDGFLRAFAPMLPSVSAFFDKVMVHVDDLPTRHNRLALLQAISAMQHGRADLSKLVGF
jgi:glycyl-tRNA synthetase